MLHLKKLPKFGNFDFVFIIIPKTIFLFYLNPTDKCFFNISKSFPRSGEFLNPEGRIFLPTSKKLFKVNPNLANFGINPDYKNPAFQIPI